MFDDFESRRITLITAPVNMRLGYDRLATTVQAYLGIDLSKAEDYVVFLNRRAKYLRIIGKTADKNGRIMINVCLDQGTFERIMSRTEGPACHSLTKSELKTLISGERLFMHRTKLLDK